MDNIYALIENNRVTNLITAAGPDSLPGFLLLPAAPHTGIGDVLLDGQLPGPKVQTLEQARAAKLAEVLHAYQAAFAPIEAVYPAAEREGWPVQEAEAKSLLADAQAETPVLSLLAQLRGRGEAPAELAGKVLQNAAQWRMVYAFLTGQQQKMYAEVAALATAEAVQAYRVSYQLPEGM